MKVDLLHDQKNIVRKHVRKHCSARKFYSLGAMKWLMAVSIVRALIAARLEWGWGAGVRNRGEGGVLKEWHRRFRQMSPRPLTDGPADVIPE